MAKEKKVPITAHGQADDKKKALQDALKQITKDYGKGAIMRLGQGVDLDIQSIPTGSLALDAALGVGGVPKGRIVEIYGPESSGKTTLALHIIAQAQKAGGEAAFIDVEHALDPSYAANLGVNIDELLVSQPDTGEQALDITEALVRSGAVDVVVVDSVAALLPKSELEGDMGDATVGLVARLMSQALRKLTGIVSKTSCVVIFINQLREKIGGYGNPETTPGGRALKFFSSVRIEVRRVEPIRADGAQVGNVTKAKVVKNKVAPPFKEVEFDILFGQGISRYGEMIDIAIALDQIEKAGAWYTYKDQRCQGKEALKNYLMANPTVADELEAYIRENISKYDPSAKKKKTKKSKKSDAADVSDLGDDLDDDLDDDDEDYDAGAGAYGEATVAGDAVDVSADDFEG